MSWVSPSPLVPKLKPKDVVMERSVPCNFGTRSGRQPVLLKRVPLLPKTAALSPPSGCRKGLILEYTPGCPPLIRSKC